MRWGSPELFWLAVAPLAALLLWVFGAMARRRLIARMGTAALIGRLLSTYSPQRRLTRQFLSGLGLVLLLVALWRPQFGRRPEALHRTGIDLAIAFDISKSMLAKDVPPSRIDAARAVLDELAGRLVGDRLALVPFAGVAFTQSPLTDDTSAIKLYLNSLDPAKMPIGGTNLAMAIDEGVKLLAGSGDKISGRSRALLLLTDGEDVSPGQGEAARKSAQKAAEAGVKLFAIGVGTQVGEPIPLYDANGQHAGYQRSTDGKPIYSKLNSKLLEELTRAADPGEPNAVRVFTYDGNQDVATPIVNALDQLQKATIEASIRHQYGEKFQWVLLPAVLLLLAELLVSERRKKTS